MAQDTFESMLLKERQRSARRRDIASSLRRGVGISVLLLFIATALLSTLYLAQIPNTKAFVMPITVVIIGLIFFALCHRFIRHLGGQLGERLFGASVIVLTALCIYLFR